MPTLAEHPSPPTPVHLLIDADEVARRVDVSGRTVRRLNSAGKLPRPVELGGSKKWKADEINRWVEAGCPPRATSKSRGKRA
ncbi:helix-turn-helix transcriptional regulator [Tautonia sociabilis]|uniref:DNA-binding protein n=1 Tax=Tautonia sociabilis TaxID=2080755 RepID=A0A432MD25_9BACT|nr:helix-turn-helix domain-containing protein [Tautonia sociabilis]RUL81295.1 DNA-binding protein [Tautonia sociabilis]